MSSIFDAVYHLLLWLSDVSGFTYKEVNVIVYYLLVPLVFLILLDRILRMWALTVSFLAGALALILWLPNFRTFAEDAFDRSVAFLNGFSALGWDYTAASVIICVLLPGLAFLILVYLAFGRSRSRASAK